MLDASVVASVIGEPFVSKHFLDEGLRLCAPCIALLDGIYSVPPDVRTDVCSGDDDAASFSGMVPKGLLQGGGEYLVAVGHAAIADDGGHLLAADDVYDAALVGSARCEIIQRR